MDLPKSTISEWLSILNLPETVQEKIEKGEITLFDGIKIARQPIEVQNRLASADNSSSSLDEEMIKLGIKRGAPKGLLTVRLVFNPTKEKDKRLWKNLEEKAKENGNNVNDFVKEILSNYLKNYKLIICDYLIINAGQFESLISPDAILPTSNCLNCERPLEPTTTKSILFFSM